MAKSRPPPNREMKPILIELWAAHDDYLILEAKSGFSFTQQVGGGACCHPEVEGYAVPLTCVNLEALAEATCDKSCGGGPLYENDLTEYEKLLPSEINGFKLQLDVSRFKDGLECYLPVLTTYRETGQKFVGWLMLKDNCD